MSFEQFKQAFECQGVDNIILEDFFKITTGNIGLAQELLVLFKEQFQNHLEQWQKPQDIHDRIHLIHAIKGAARCIAARKLADLSDDVERQLRNNQEVTLTQNTDLQTYCTALLTYITHIETLKK